VEDTQTQGAPISTPRITTGTKTIRVAVAAAGSREIHCGEGDTLGDVLRKNGITYQKETRMSVNGLSVDPDKYIPAKDDVVVIASRVRAA